MAFRSIFSRGKVWNTLSTLKEKNLVDMNDLYDHVWRQDEQKTVKASEKSFPEVAYKYPTSCLQSPHGKSRKFHIWSTGMSVCLLSSSALSSKRNRDHLDRSEESIPFYQNWNDKININWNGIWIGILLELAKLERSSTLSGVGIKLQNKRSTRVSKSPYFNFQSSFMNMKRQFQNDDAVWYDSAWQKGKIGFTSSWISFFVWAHSIEKHNCEWFRKNHSTSKYLWKAEFAIVCII